MESQILKGLNQAQREAVVNYDSPSLIIAGAGSGKTRVLTSRIAYMIEQGVAPYNILALTFTNKAAEQMRERIAQMLPDGRHRYIRMGTFHSVFSRILRDNADRIGFPQSFTIYEPSDCKNLLKTIVRELNLDDTKYKPAMLASRISYAKNCLVTPGAYLANASFGAEDRRMQIPEFGNIYNIYCARCKRNGAMDFDDLLLQTNILLRDCPDVTARYQEQFKYILVDEYQDTNYAQYVIIRRLSQLHSKVCVVGDDDQSIYGWRGAQISNILEFERFFPNPSVIKLEENYRCTAPILDTANALIRHNLGRRDKTLRAHKGGGEAVRLISMPGDAEEAEFIITDIENVRRQEGRPWEDFAILFRANTQSRIIEQTLREHKIPYRMVGAQSFFDRKEVKDLISYLATIENPQADEYLLRILNTPPRGISELTSHLAIDWSREHGNSVWAALQDEEFLAALSTRARNSVQAFNELIAKYIDLFQDKETDFGDILEQLIEETGFSEYVTRLCKTEAEIQKRLVSIGDVKASLRNFWQPGKTLRDYLAQVTLDKEDNDDDVENKPGVCLITMHAAKGLEFPVVYLVGLEEGILPHKRSLEDGNCDEERRLLYVGITRAQEKLMLTYCATRLRYGDRMPCQRSSFLSEIPPHLMEYSKWEDLMNAEATEEESGNFFDSLRSMLLEEE